MNFYCISCIFHYFYTFLFILLNVWQKRDQSLSNINDSLITYSIIYRKFE